MVLLDNGRSSILTKPKQRQTLKCIRCAACMNSCPVYRQTGGHAYGSVYPGPIGAILTPQLMQMHHAQSLPFASSLCGACYEVCPVKINIPEVLLELRAQVVNQERRDLARFFDPMYLGLRIASLLFAWAWLFHTSQFMGRIGIRLFTRKDGWIHSLPSVGGKWTQTRDLRGFPKQTFHGWWAARSRQSSPVSSKEAK
jgi:L-lactate dehydrogenase complex protein LldF